MAIVAVGSAAAADLVVVGYLASSRVAEREARAVRVVPMVGNWAVEAVRGSEAARGVGLDLVAG